MFYESFMKWLLFFRTVFHRGGVGVYFRHRIRFIAKNISFLQKVACFLIFTSFQLFLGLAGTINWVHTKQKQTLRFVWLSMIVWGHFNGFAEKFSSSVKNCISRTKIALLGQKKKKKKNYLVPKLSQAPPSPNEVLAAAHQLILLMCSSFRFYAEEWITFIFSPQTFLVVLIVHYSFGKLMHLSTDRKVFFRLEENNREVSLVGK